MTFGDVLGERARLTPERTALVEQSLTSFEKSKSKGLYNVRR